MGQEYSTSTRPGIGASTMPGGAAYYDAALRWHTTTNLTAQRIHDLGQEEVMRIHQQMEALIQKDGFNSTVREYIAQLRNNTDNFYSTEASSHKLQIRHDM